MSSIVVQKYGGSSVATPDHIRRVAQRVVDTRRAGHQVVVVVSAMGDTTDELLALAHSVSADPERRELDMLLTVGERISMALLSMAIHDLGYPAVSFTGSQSGIITTDNHTDARILRVTPVRIREALDRGRVVIVAGFQGVSERLEITSLGRGGSDTTAVALAAALDAEWCEICSDVDGVYSADPRAVPGARRLESLAYEEMQQLADGGAKVLNAEAVEWARRQGIEVRCVATEGPRRPGTSVRARVEGLEHPRVVAVTSTPDIVYLEASQPGASAPDGLESTLVAHGAGDARVWRLGSAWGALVSRRNIHGMGAFRDAMHALGTVSVREDLAQVAVVGRALTAPPGIVERATAALRAAGVEISGRLLDPGQAIFLVDGSRADDAVARLHAELVEAD